METENKEKQEKQENHNKESGRVVIDVNFRPSSMNPDAWMQKKAKKKAEREAREKEELEALRLNEQNEKEKANREVQQKEQEEDEKRAKDAKSKLNAIENLKQTFKDILFRGATLIKYGRKGSPHEREVWLTEGGRLCWANVGSRQKKDAKYMDLSVGNPVEIHKGKQSIIFKTRGKGVEEKMCFSVVCPTRSLDLLCKTENERDRWVDLLEKWRAFEQKKITDKKQAEEAQKQMQELKAKAELQAKQKETEDGRLRALDEKEKEEKRLAAEAKAALLVAHAQKLNKVDQTKEDEKESDNSIDFKSYLRKAPNVPSEAKNPNSEQAERRPSLKSNLRKVTVTSEPKPNSTPNEVVDFKGHLRKQSLTNVKKLKPKKVKLILRLT